MKKNRSLLRFIAIMSLSGLIGGIIGFSLSFLDDSFRNKVNYLFSSLYGISHYLGITLGIILCSILSILYKNLTHCTQNEIEDDEYFEKQHKKTNLLFLLTSINSVLQLYFIIISDLKVNHNEKIGYTLFFLVAYIIFLFWGLYIEVKTINFLKKVNPEKKGDPLSFRFQKDWIESSDEAERLITFHASYKSFQFMNRVYPILFIVLLLLNSIMSGAIFASNILVICYLLHIVSYYLFIGKLTDQKLS